MNSKLKYLPGLFKSIRFNFKYFSWSIAWKLPVLLSANVWLRKTKGRVLLELPRNEIRTGMIKIGFMEVGVLDPDYSQAIWHNDGTIVFKGIANLAMGVKLTVAGRLEFGIASVVNMNSAISCSKEIILGDRCMLGWETLIMDSDFHLVLNEMGERINPDAKIELGKNVWVGSRAIVLKGTHIADNCIVAAGSLVHKKFDEANCTIGGNPAKVIKSNISWKI